MVRIVIAIDLGGMGGLQTFGFASRMPTLAAKSAAKMGHPTFVVD
jgi:hypothetical protein